MFLGSYETRLGQKRALDLEISKNLLNLKKLFQGTMMAGLTELGMSLFGQLKNTCVVGPLVLTVLRDKREGMEW